MKTDINRLGKLALWKEWQERVKSVMPIFAATDIYCSQLGITTAEFERVAEVVEANGPIDIPGICRDSEFGAITCVTKSLGIVNRMWLDANMEVQMMRRHVDLRTMDVLDIGAGYGRLAAVMAQYVKSFTCVDAVPISTEICRTYCKRFAPGVKVISLDEFKAQADKLHFDLAINVHSWNECQFDEVKLWLDVLVEMGVPWLFTVTHGTPGVDGWYTWGGPGFRSLIERDFSLVAEEANGLYGHPQYLWRRK